MIIRCPENISTAMSLLKRNGFDCYAVGGCVRDSIMDVTPNDWDMTTSALPEEIIKTFSDYKTLPTGIKHGTVTVIINSVPIEITTMRIDGKYTDNRRPDEVIFTSKIEEDLSRRDFTVNAIAYNDCGIVDPFDGQNDIERKIIRCVGNPDKRFNEDALRIIRALRFASVLEFDIEDETKKSILKNTELLENVAKERIRAELVKLLCGKNAGRILAEYADVFYFIIPQLKEYGISTVISDCEPTPVMRTAGLLFGIRNIQTVYEILRELRFSNAETKEICDIISICSEKIDCDKIKLKRLCSKYSTDTVKQAIKFYKSTDNETGRTALKLIDEIEKSNTPLCVKELDISGTDLLSIGITGNAVGVALSDALDAVINEKISNNKHELLRYIRDNYGTKN